MNEREAADLISPIKVHQLPQPMLREGIVKLTSKRCKVSIRMMSMPPKRPHVRICEDKIVSWYSIILEHLDNP